MKNQVTVLDDVEKLRRRIIELVEKVNESYWELSELLYIVYNKGYFKRWGYNSFKDYVEKELDIGERKAYYLVNIWYWFVVKGNVSDVEKAKKLGWSKAKELVGVVTPENQKEWLRKALKLSHDMLIKEVKEYVRTQQGQVSGRVDKDDVVHRVFFVLFEDQYNNVMHALELAKQISNSDKQGHNLDLICTEFLATHQLPKGNDYISNLRRFFMSLEMGLKNVKVIVIDTDKNEVIYGEEFLRQKGFLEGIEK